MCCVERANGALFCGGVCCPVTGAVLCHSALRFRVVCCPLSFLPVYSCSTALCFAVPVAWQVSFLPCLGPSAEARLLIRQKKYSEAIAYLAEFLALHCSAVQEACAGSDMRSTLPLCEALQHSDNAFWPSSGTTSAARDFSTMEQGTAAAEAAAGRVDSTAISATNRQHSLSLASQAVVMARASALLSSAHAQIGALLLFDMEFERAVDHLMEAGPQVFRPPEVLALFPHLTARWHALVGTCQM